MIESQRVGYRGEQLAARYLTNLGYEIVSANYATKSGEIDIIASRKNVICFVEVKSRTPGQILPPIEAVDLHKQENVRTVASVFLKMEEYKNYTPRFDICEVILKDMRTADITYHENAF